MFLVFAFIAFVFYRVMTTAMFNDNMSLVACLLSAVITGAILSISSAFYLARVLRFNGEIEHGAALTVWPMAPVFFATALLNVAQGFLITFGFSQDLYDEITRSRWGSLFEKDYFWFTVVFLIPVLSHFFISRIIVKNAASGEHME